VIGKTNHSITVNVSGITFDAHGVDATAGVLFLDAQGSVDRSRVTRLDLDESANGYTVPGGFRSNPFGYGIAQFTAATNKGANAEAVDPTEKPSVRTLTIDHTRVDHYNAIGVRIDSATSDYSPYALGSTPLPPSGIENRGVLTDDQIIGRNLWPELQRPDRGRPDRDRRRLRGLRRRHPDPAAIAAHHRSAVRPGRRAGDRRGVGADVR
jgi:hypothetical protein